LIIPLFGAGLHERRHIDEFERIELNVEICRIREGGASVRCRHRTLLLIGITLNWRGWEQFSGLAGKLVRGVAAAATAFTWSALCPRRRCALQCRDRFPAPVRSSPNRLPCLQARCGRSAIHRRNRRYRARAVSTARRATASILACAGGRGFHKALRPR